MFNINNEMTSLYVESMEQDILIEKLSMLYEMVDRECALNISQAELKVYKENGSYDDLEYLVEAAEAEAEAKKQNIFSKMLEAIASAFRKIAASIKKFIIKDKAENDPEEIIEISDETEKNYNEFLHCWSSIQNGINKIKNGDWSGALTLLKGLAIPSFVVASGTTVAVQMVKKKRGEVTKMSETLSSISDKISAGIESIKNVFKKNENKKPKDENQSKGQNIFIEKLNGIKKFVQTLLNKFLSFLTKSSTKIKSKVDRSIGRMEAEKINRRYERDQKRKNKESLSKESTLIDDSLFDELINEAADEDVLNESFGSDDIQDLMDFFDID